MFEAPGETNQCRGMGPGPRSRKNGPQCDLWGGKRVGKKNVLLYIFSEETFVCQKVVRE